MTALDPAAALAACETSLRTLMEQVYSEAYGSGWLQRVLPLSVPQKVAERQDAETKKRTRRGAVAVPAHGLAYLNLYDLIAIAEQHWQPLAPAFSGKKETIVLLNRLESLRDTVAHNRALLPHEADLLSGIAGQVRNQVTIYMSSQDAAGDYYPRIESVSDSYGRTAEEWTNFTSCLWMMQEPLIQLKPGDVVTFECVAVDPQERDIFWYLRSRSGELREATVPSQEKAVLTWTVENTDVAETS